MKRYNRVLLKLSGEALAKQEVIDGKEKVVEIFDSEIIEKIADVIKRLVDDGTQVGIVIGAGNAAMDVARTAIRHGVEYLTCFSITKKVAASDYEYSYAKLEGTQFEYNKRPVEIVDEGVIFCDVIENEDVPEKYNGLRLLSYYSLAEKDRALYPYVLCEKVVAKNVWSESGIPGCLSFNAEDYPDVIWEIIDSNIVEEFLPRP